MEHCELMRQAGAYRDGELSDSESLIFEAHMAGCEICKKEVAQLSAISQLLAKAQTPAIPWEVSERLHNNVPSVRERSVLKLAESLIAAAAVIIVACGGLLWQGGGAIESSGANDTAWVNAAVILNIETVTSDAQQLTQWMAEGLAPETDNE